MSRKLDLRVPPTCHPEKAYYASGKCRRCYMRGYDRGSRIRRREKILSYKRKNRYSVTNEQYQQMLSTYESCAICGGPWTKKGPSIDHNHETGKVRGLLCHPCNTGIGFLREDPRIIKEALRYLEFWS